MIIQKLVEPSHTVWEEGGYKEKGNDPTIPVTLLHARVGRTEACYRGRKVKIVTSGLDCFSAMWI